LLLAGRKRIKPPPLLYAIFGSSLTGGRSGASRCWSFCMSMELNILVGVTIPYFGIMLIFNFLY
jgi:hypothetical protein